MVVAKKQGKKVSIFGVTGSIGCSTERIILQSDQLFDVQVVTASTNVMALVQSAKTLQASYAVIGDVAYYPALKEELEGTGIKPMAGAEALVEAAAFPVDWVMMAIMGSVALAPTMAAIKQGGTIALANKESLVCAGDLMKKAAVQSGASLVPVDSEHNALFQLYQADHSKHLKRLTLTASGGPFRDTTAEQLAHVTVKDALKHPNWSMGAKITIDSATMINKGLEMIEAYHLFPVQKDQIHVVVHPQSIIHGLLEYDDGSVLAQMSHPSMLTPIAYALAWPDRMSIEHQSLNLELLGKLTFEPINPVLKRSITLAQQVLHEGGIKPLVFNTANEVAVQYFLQERIKFLDILSIIERMCHDSKGRPVHDIEETLALIEQIKHQAQTVCESYSSKCLS